MCQLFSFCFTWPTKRSVLFQAQQKYAYNFTTHVVKDVFTRMTYSGTSSYEIGDVSFFAFGNPPCSRRKKYAKLKSWFSDHRNVFGDMSADLRSLYHVGKGHEIGSPTCRSTVIYILNKFLSRFFLAADVRAWSAESAMSGRTPSAKPLAQQLAAQAVFFV